MNDFNFLDPWSRVPAQHEVVQWCLSERVFWDGSDFFHDPFSLCCALSVLNELIHAFGPRVLIENDAGYIHPAQKFFVTGFIVEEAGEEVLSCANLNLTIGNKVYYEAPWVLARKVNFRAGDGLLCIEPGTIYEVSFKFFTKPPIESLHFHFGLMGLKQRPIC